MTLSTLTRARARIADEGRWTQEVSARNSKGKWVSSYDPEAVCWCLVGACYAETGYIQEACDTVDFLRGLIGGSVGDFNDTHTHAEVIALLDRAIATLGDDNAG